MMALLAKGLGALFGPYVNVLVSVLLIACVALGKFAWEMRDARLIAEGEKICTADWEQRVRNAEQVKAAARVAEIEAQAEAERQSADGLREELQTVRAEMDALRSSANAADDKCLSDGVLDTLRTRQSAPKGGPKKRPPLTN